MKKIDLHTHTIATQSDSSFIFSLEKLAEYITSRSIDALAITNHNVFGLDQYKQISASVGILVLPGIEVDLEGGHILVLADPEEVEDFAQRCLQVTQKILTPSTSLTLDEFNIIFPDLKRYILIPHYDKTPIVPSRVIERLGSEITAGEVASPKKFVYCKKDKSQPVPVYFSDCRFRENMENYPMRQTFIEVGDLTFAAIKYALCDRTKVYLTEHSGHSYFQANGNGLVLSTGLNVVIGERSSGKSFTLDALERGFDNVKYIKQFSLVEHSDNHESVRFNAALREKQSLFVQGFLREFKACVEDVVDISTDLDERNVESYLEALIQHAREYERSDSFSKAVLFSETNFAIDQLDNLVKLIDSVVNISNNIEYREVVDKYLPHSSLIGLAIEMMELYERNKESELAKCWANDLISSVKAELQRRTASTLIPEIDFYSMALNKVKVEKFIELVLLIQRDCQIYSQDIQNFKIIARTKRFSGPGEMKDLSGKKIAFSTAFSSYDKPYEFLLRLKDIEGLQDTDLYKFFVAIEYNILNKHGFHVSGGERSEFRLLQEIADAMHFDLLLIDEPESSFDNLFLDSEVNQLIKEISESMPVVLVTHNSTVGASIKPDYLVYTKRLIGKDGIRYMVYAGHPSDKVLRTPTGETHPNHQALLSCLEAGTDAYLERGRTYETLKD